MILIDACVKRDMIGDADDYFVIAETKTAANELLGELKLYVEASGIHVRQGLVPFVCGARHGATPAVIRAANKLDSAVRDVAQPLGASEALKGDAEYVNALAVVSSYAFERAAAPSSQAAAAASGSPGAPPPSSVSQDEFQRAAYLIRERTSASSLLFLGVLGTSLSPAKQAALSVGSYFVGVATAFATAGLGTGYYLVFMPGYEVDGRVMEGALIDLASGAMPWSRAVKVGGDPLDPKVMARRKDIDVLFQDLLFKRASAAATP